MFIWNITAVSCYDCCLKSKISDVGPAVSSHFACHGLMLPNTTVLIVALCWGITKDGENLQGDIQVQNIKKLYFSINTKKQEWFMYSEKDQRTHKRDSKEQFLKTKTMNHWSCKCWTSLLG